MELQGCVVFAGDSVTDCGRREDADGLGHGYVRELAGDTRLADCRVVNVGVGGDRLADLEQRWQQDVVAEQPDIVSVLIGINDTWRHFDSGIPSDLDLFAGRYRSLLAALPAHTRIILVEPFVVPVSQDQVGWRDDLDPRIAAVAHLAEEFGAVRVPLDGTLNQRAESLGAAEIAADGVHPTERGHHEIAAAWLHAVTGP